MGSAPNFLVESQNILLSEFFGNRVSIREPKEEGALVLTSENSEMLNKLKDILKNQLVVLSLNQNVISEQGAPGDHVQLHISCT